VVIVDPKLCLSLPPAQTVVMGLASLSMCFDAMVVGSLEGTLKQGGRREMILEGARSVGQGLALLEQDPTCLEGR
jgi:alcohol dehydrogenase class IV